MWVGLLILSSCGNKAEAPLIEGMNPGECSDRADNDSDGWFDCEDSDCEGAPDCEPGATDTSDTSDASDTSDTEDSNEPSDEPLAESNCTEMMTNTVTGSVGGQNYSLNDAVWDSDGDGSILMLMFEASASDPVNCSRILEGTEEPPPTLLVRSFVESLPATVEFQTNIEDPSLGVALFLTSNGEAMAEGGSVVFDRFGTSSNGYLVSLNATGINGDGSFTAAEVEACHCPGLYSIIMGDFQNDTGFGEE